MAWPLPARPLLLLAEGVGFEPTVPCGTTDFESVTFDHSDTPPRCYPASPDFFLARSSRKKPLNSSLHSAASTPSVTATR
jgi:hypothetical protein